jgi:transposase
VKFHIGVKRYTFLYSPDLNPIEKMWTKVKAIPRKLKARTEAELIAAVADALKHVTEYDCLGWFKSCGYVFS